MLRAPRWFRGTTNEPQAYAKDWAPLVKLHALLIWKKVHIFYRENISAYLCSSDFLTSLFKKISFSTVPSRDLTTKNKLDTKTTQI